MNPILTKNFVAETAIPGGRLVKHGSTAGTVALATAATDAICGASVSDVSAEAGERVDVVMLGLSYVTAGAAIVAGAPITADASGRAVAAAPAAGANARLAGFGHEAATALGDQVVCHIVPGVMQGA